MKLRALLLSTLLLAGPAQAQPLPQDHRQLLDTLAEDGINIYINSPPNVCGPNSDLGDIDGMYTTIGGSGYMAICQDNAVSSEIVEWTDNDLDTIRHETFHAIQDCMIGDNRDMTLDTVFTDIRDVVIGLGVDRAKFIYETYKERGLDDDGIVLELEAFYAAQFLSPSQIEEMYVGYCK